MLYICHLGDTPEAVACVQELLKVYEKKDVNAKSQIDGQTALHIASFKCHQNVISVLLQDANTDIWVLDNQRRTALHWATEACKNYKFYSQTKSVQFYVLLRVPFSKSCLRKTSCGVGESSGLADESQIPVWRE
jgi:hypothetical protein